MGQARPAIAADCAKQGSVMSAGISRIRIFAADADPIARRRAPLLRFIWPRRTLAVTLGCYLMCLCLLAGQAYALDPNKRITQYIHSGWRLRDGSAPTGAYNIAQTSDGFLWFISGDMNTFDGVRFTSWDGPPNGGSITKGASFGQIVNAFGDHGGGLWVFGLHGIAHLKGCVVISQFELEGLRNLQNVGEDNDGSIWVVRGNINVSDAPLLAILLTVR